ncbi:BTAD domain-containing putative transcriptional regulator [Streptomyces sp. NPDC019937]|uniref:AfsR/SARP family transcriptional regulator n=1 Tax=Streptomyces sp. NPDC019937 TaxID=3154787 RepID=UPI003401F1D9
MQFSVLGPLIATTATGSVTLGPHKQQLLLAALLCRPDQVVSVDHLVDALWNEDPPKSAGKNIQVYVHHLRRTLAAADETARVVHQRPGYRLAIDPEKIDTVRFEHTVDLARRAATAGDPARVDRLTGDAMALWRGRPFTGLEGPALLEDEAARLEERRLSALEVLFTARLGLGLYHEVLEEVEPLILAHPYREQLRAQYMQALHGVGRQSDALIAFDDARRLFSLELGLEPGTVLRRLQQDILAGTSPTPAPRDSLHAAPPAAAAPAGRDTAAVQLPPGLADFTGRRRELAELLPAVSAHAAEAPAPWQVTLVTGRPGVGKSSLAVAAAHAAEGAFPGGRYYVDLMDPRGRPKDASQALAELLQELDHAAPPLCELSELLWRYRAHADDAEPALVVLDNATSASQVRPLLPNSPVFTTVVTSCTPLAGLDGARVVELDPLPPEDSLALLRHIVGAQRVAAEPAAARRIVEACEGLPLALRIAGGRLAAHRRWPMEGLADALESPDRLDEFTVGDVDLRKRLMRGYAAAGEADWSAVRLLAHEGEFSFREALHRLGAGPAEARRVLGRLLDAQLIGFAPDPGPDGHCHFRLPRLVLDLARDQMRADVELLGL